MIIIKETKRNNRINNKICEVCVTYDEFNLFPMEIIEIVKFFNYRIGKKLETDGGSLN